MTESILSEAEEIPLIHLCVAGDIDARNRLILANERTFQIVAHSHRRSRVMDHDELVSEFRFHVMKVAHKMIWTPGYRFSMFASRVSHNHFKDLYRNKLRRERLAVMHARHTSDSWHTLEDKTANLAIPEMNEDLSILREAASKLPDEYKKAFFAQYNLESIVDIGLARAINDCGLTEQKFKYDKYSAINYIKKYIRVNHKDFSYSLAELQRGCRFRMGLSR